MAAVYMNGQVRYVMENSSFSLETWNGNHALLLFSNHNSSATADDTTHFFTGTIYKVSFYDQFLLPPNVDAEYKVGLNELDGNPNHHTSISFSVTNMRMLEAPKTFLGITAKHLKLTALFVVPGFIVLAMLCCACHVCWDHYAGCCCRRSRSRKEQQVTVKDLELGGTFVLFLKVENDSLYEKGVFGWHCLGKSFEITFCSTKDKKKHTITGGLYGVAAHFRIDQNQVLWFHQEGMWIRAKKDYSIRYQPTPKNGVWKTLDGRQS
jgi:hypothetical protein